jgi:hypothetical protein
LALSKEATNASIRKPDRVAGLLAAGFVGLLLATELVLTLPNETESPASTVADPSAPASAGKWNALEPRGDDILFVGIVLFEPKSQ